MHTLPHLLQELPPRVQTRQAHQRGKAIASACCGVSAICVAHAEPQHELRDLPLACVQEEDQLIADWEPEPLVPTEHPSDREVDPAPIVSGYAAI